ncbi:hypothetical protein SVIOM74S_04516 [Streptomyces violarus]
MTPPRRTHQVDRVHGVGDRPPGRLRGGARVEGPGHRVEVARAAEPGGQHAVGDRAEDRRADRLAGLAAEQHGRGRRAALRPPHRRLHPDDQRQLEQTQGGPAAASAGSAAGLPGVRQEREGEQDGAAAPISMAVSKSSCGTRAGSAPPIRASSTSIRTAPIRRPRARGPAPTGRRWAGTPPAPPSAGPARPGPRGDRTPPPHPARDDRLRRPALTSTTTATRASPAANRASEGADSHGHATPPCTSAVSSTPPQANTASAPAQSTRACGPVSRSRLVEMTDDQPQRDRADGQVDQEDPAPVRIGGERPRRDQGRRPPRPPTPWTASTGSWDGLSAGRGRRRASGRCPEGHRRPRPCTTRNAMAPPCSRPARTAASRRGRPPSPRRGPVCGRRCRRACRTRAG